MPNIMDYPEERIVYKSPEIDRKCKNNNLYEDPSIFFALETPERKRVLIKLNTPQKILFIRLLNSLSQFTMNYPTVRSVKKSYFAS